MSTQHLNEDWVQIGHDTWVRKVPGGLLFRATTMSSQGGVALRHVQCDEPEAAKFIMECRKKASY